MCQVSTVSKLVPVKAQPGENCTSLRVVPVGNQAGMFGISTTGIPREYRGDKYIPAGFGGGPTWQPVWFPLTRLEPVGAKSPADSTLKPSQRPTEASGGTRRPFGLSCSRTRELGLGIGPMTVDPTSRYLARGRAKLSSWPSGS